MAISQCQAMPPDGLHRESLASVILIDNEEISSMLNEELSKETIAIAIAEQELDSSSESGYTESPPTEPSLNPELITKNIIQKAFQESKSQWIDDPVISEWRNPKHQIRNFLPQLDDLHSTWSRMQPSRLLLSPLSPDTFWLEIGRALASAGLPWHNNQINMPDEIDSSWPFHFKSFETAVLRAKGSRVGDPRPSGYVCCPSEANWYCIRALQQELRMTVPTRQPVLVYDCLDVGIIEAAGTFFGLETHFVKLSRGKESVLRDLGDVTSQGRRPIIFAATLANHHGECDNVGLVSEISEVFPLILHLDAARNFDYVTTLTEIERKHLGIEKFTLGVRSLEGSLRAQDGSIVASTIVAGSSSHAPWAPAAALKPASIGEKQQKVAYIRASDSTLAGSRDAIAPLWMAVHEIRFGKSGLREIHQQCFAIRVMLMQALEERGITAVAPTYTLDLIIKSCSYEQRERLIELGGVLVHNNDTMLMIKPSTKLTDIKLMMEILSPGRSPSFGEDAMSHSKNFSIMYPIPQDIIVELKETVQAWKVATRSAAGYPFNMGSCSALGPVIGCFLDLVIPPSWIQAKESEIISSRLEMFGLSTPEAKADFKGVFTNGSTMGNRIGIHAALSHFPGAHVYFSAESHYSVSKTLRDCDTLSNRWSPSSLPRYARIHCAADGSLCADALVEQALADKERCLQGGEEYRVVLFANMGTTFVGARDDLESICSALGRVGIEIAYIHVDGALDFGFDSCGVALGPPGKIRSDGVPFVQGVTLSHHKALGTMVSGEVLYYSPGGEEQRQQRQQQRQQKLPFLPNLTSSPAFAADPRAVFETWLYAQAYTPADTALLKRTCEANAARLETALRRCGTAGLATKRDAGARSSSSTITTVLERPTAWITEEFSLRPEGDWVHFIAMPHVSRATVDLFVDRVAAAEAQCRVALGYVAPLFAAVLGAPVGLRRLRCRDGLAGDLAALARRAVPLGGGGGGKGSPVRVAAGSLVAVLKVSLRGAVSVAVLDGDEQLLAVVLAESGRDRSIRAGPVLIAARYSDKGGAVVDIARQLTGFMARNMNVLLKTDDASYSVYIF
ncbi:pyridoxal phosphate-dependent transferase [Biscogniauxia marginata]|nr:pyridoxal phosphate-dependent transferase [Biscogniauxia marginata]